MESIERVIAKDLLSIRAVFFRPEEPFTWASGIKSPVYCDNRLTLTAPAVRNDVERGLAELTNAPCCLCNGSYVYDYEKETVLFSRHLPFTASEFFEYFKRFIRCYTKG